jgi:hypothetical protein
MVAVYSNGAAQDGADSGYGCWQEKRNSTLTVLSLAGLPDQFANNQQTPWNLQTGQTFYGEFTQFEDGGVNTLTCHAQLDAQDFTNTRTDTNTYQGTIGFVVYRAAVSFDYVLVYSLDGPAN